MNFEDQTDLEKAEEQLGSRFSESTHFTQVQCADGRVVEVSAIENGEESWNELAGTEKLSCMVGMNFNLAVKKLLVKEGERLLQEREIKETDVEGVAAVEREVVESKTREYQEEVAKSKFLALLALRCGVSDVESEDEANITVEVFDPSGEKVDLKYKAKSLALFQHSLLDLRIAEQILGGERAQEWSDEQRMALLTGITLHDWVKSSNFFTHHIDSAVLAGAFLEEMGEYHPEAMPFVDDDEEREQFAVEMESAIKEHSGYSMYMNKEEITNSLINRASEVVDNLSFEGQLSGKYFTEEALSFDEAISEMFEEPRIAIEKAFRLTNGEETETIGVVQSNFLQEVDRLIETNQSQIQEAATKLSFGDSSCIQKYLKARAEDYLARHFVTTEQKSGQIRYDIYNGGFETSKRAVLGRAVKTSDWVRCTVRDYVVTATSKDGDLEEAREALPEFLSDYLKDRLPLPSSEVAESLAEADNAQLCTPMGQKKIVEIIIGGIGHGEDVGASIEGAIAESMDSALNNLALFEDDSVVADIAMEGMTAWVLAVHSRFPKDEDENVTAWREKFEAIQANVEAAPRRVVQLEHIEKSRNLAGSNDQLAEVLEQARGEGKDAFAQSIKDWIGTHLVMKSAEAIKLQVRDNDLPEEFPEHSFKGLFSDEGFNDLFVPKWWVNKGEEAVAEFDRYVEENFGGDGVDRNGLRNQGVVERVQRFKPFLDRVDPKGTTLTVAQMKVCQGNWGRGDTPAEDFRSQDFSWEGDYALIMKLFFPASGEINFEKISNNIFDIQEALDNMVKFFYYTNKHLCNEMTNHLVDLAAQEAVDHDLEIAQEGYDFLW